MFFILLILVILLIIIIINSKQQLVIYNLDISTARTEKINKDFSIYLEIIIFNKIKILKLNIKKIKNKQRDFKLLLEQAKKIEQKTSTQKLAKQAIESLKYLQLQIIKADVKIELGTKDAAVTAILIGMIAGILGNLLKRQKFETKPIYKEQNILNIKLNCIIRFNLINYIYKTIMKGRDKNERKSSYRRSYAYSNE